MHDKNGGPAFPTTVRISPLGDALGEPDDGMTLRDYFAGQALGGLTSEKQNMVAIAVNQGGPESIAHSCYVMANAMLQARKGL